MLHFVKKYLFVVLTGLLSAFPLFSQDDPLRFEQILPGSDENSNTITKILQDRQGFLWFGTKKGLIRYDGYQFAQYKYNLNKTGGISGDFIRDFAEDNHGDLWMAIENGGLNRYIRARDTFESFRSDESDTTGLPTNDLMTVLPDSNGTIWIGTKKGLCRFDPITRKITRIRLFMNGAEPMIMRIIIDHKGMLWMATRNAGLIAYDPITGIPQYYLHNSADSASVCSNDLWCVYEDKERNLWIGSWGNGLDRFDRSSGKFYHYRYNPKDVSSISSDNIYATYEDHEHRFWISTYGNGLNLLDRTTGKFTRFLHDPDNVNSISSIYSLAIFQDQSGSLWVGAYGKGLNVNFKTWKKVDVQKTIINNKKQVSLGAVQAIFKTSSGNLLIGSAYHALSVYDTTTNRIYTMPLRSRENHEISGFSVLFLHESNKHTIWLGTNLGLARVDYEKKMMDLFKNPWTDFQHTENLCELPDGRLIANVIDNGPYIFDPRIKRFSKLTGETGEIGRLEGKRILCHYHDGDSVLWLGTNRSGLYKYQYQDKRLTQFTVVPNDPHSVSNSVVLVIHPGKDGTLWIGTEGGLNRFDKRNERFKVYREEDGLINDIVYGVMDGREGTLWIITSIGVSRFDPAKETFRNYDHTDGFPDGKFSFKACLRLDDGTLLAGHEQGLVRFHPDDLKDNPYPPPVVVTGFKKLNRAVDFGQNITMINDIELSYKDYLIAFEFAALNFIHPEKNRYAYMIEGFDKQWNYTGKERTAVYTNLDPGTYTFRVRGSNNDGLWNDAGASIRLVINPPIWKTWWAYTFYGLFTLFIIYAGHQWRSRTIRNRNKELTIKVEERTRELRQAQAELVQSGKMASLGEMVAGLSHEINNPVTFVTGNIQNIRHEIKQFLNTPGHKDLTALISEIDHELESSLYGAKRIRDIVQNMKHFSKLDESEYKGIKIHNEIDTILDLFFNQLRDIQFIKQYDSTLNDRLINCYASQINQCLRNIIINAVQAIREAEKNNMRPQGTGQVIIETKQSDHKILMSFTDNGIGIRKEIIDKIFDPFFTTREVGAGKGLGLSEAYGIIQKHNGTITVQSEYSKGTKVEICIPFKQLTCL